MKFLIASDIHGSEFYCKKVLDAFENEKADRLILLGDILYHDWVIFAAWIERN